MKEASLEAIGYICQDIVSRFLIFSLLVLCAVLGLSLSNCLTVTLSCLLSSFYVIFSHLVGWSSILLYLHRVGESGHNRMVNIQH